MALVTTPGGEDSNSYASVAEADAYHATRGDNAAWSSASNEEKEKHLQWATRSLDNLVQFSGRKATAEQALAWPRVNVADEDGWLVDSTTIPQRVKNAAAEFAFQLLQEDWTQGLGPIVDEGVQIGSLRTSRERHRPVPAPVASILRSFARSVSGASLSIDMVRG